MNKPRQKHQRGPTCSPVLSFGGWGAILCHLGFHKWYDGPEQWVTVQPHHRRMLRLEPGLYMVTWCKRAGCLRRTWTPAALVAPLPKEAAS